MKNRRKIKGILVSSLFLFTMGANANEALSNSLQPLEPGYFTGTIPTVIELNDQPLLQSFDTKLKRLKAGTLTNTKIISLMYLTPTPEMMEKAEKIASAIDFGLASETDFSEGIQTFKASNSAVSLEMNNVPVLDQGQFGTCVTFATTGALDAVLDKGDFIDQQCSLAHNLYLGNNYWDGAYYASQIINPLQKHGVVQKHNCSAEYPADTQKIKTEDYKLLVDNSVNLNSVKYQYYPNITLDNVRSALDNGRRVAMGFMLKNNGDQTSVIGFDVKVENKKYRGGLWACKQPNSTKNYCGYSYGGHEVVIVGYDDGQKLLKIRNSWSEAAGENGEFYMTYEFFNAMGIDGTEIWSK